MSNDRLNNSVQSIRERLVLLVVYLILGIELYYVFNLGTITEGFLAYFGIVVILSYLWKLILAIASVFITSAIAGSFYQQFGKHSKKTMYEFK